MGPLSSAALIVQVQGFGILKLYHYPILWEVSSLCVQANVRFRTVKIKLKLEKKGFQGLMSWLRTWLKVKEC